jgi:small nuclear ribonucleoprotein
VIAQQQPHTKRPLAVLQKATNKVVSVRLKSEIEYKGRMSNVDPYMNVILVDAEESENGSKVATYGKVVIRGNNVLYIRIEDKL